MDELWYEVPMENGQSSHAWKPLKHNLPLPKDVFCIFAEYAVETLKPLKWLIW
jgi:hypothetical protein